MNPSKIILVGPGGSGKDHLASLLQGLGYCKAVSCTTRPPRPGEQDGVDYHFITESDFRRRIENGSFREYYSFGPMNWQYGTLESEFRSASLFIMSPKGLALLSDEERTAFEIIWLNPPEDVRRERLAARADADSVDRRLAADREDFEDFELYDVQIVNPMFSVEDVLNAVRAI